jgi:hypothetical protein
MSMLTIDDFTKGPFFVQTLQPGQAKTVPPQPDCAFRQTIFTNPANVQNNNLFDQPSTLDVRKGIFIL